LEEIELENVNSEENNSEKQNFLQEILGEEGMDIVEYLKNSDVATDEEMAESLGIKLNIIRKVLYKLYDYRLASYKRTKDKTIGWYIYTWKLDLKRIDNILTERKRRILNELTKKLEFETQNIFFHCKNDKFKVPFDIATDYNFKCPQCEGEMVNLDNQMIVMNLEDEIKQLKKELGNV
jgi:transcription initiation factor TFIIE subunit alpha|tara:strand:- start:10 stop:546 length:537 start_codon:yes stop_codon:yes gene_type:complete